MIHGDISSSKHLPSALPSSTTRYHACTKAEVLANARKIADMRWSA